MWMLDWVLAWQVEMRQVQRMLDESEVWVEGITLTTEKGGD